MSGFEIRPLDSDDADDRRRAVDLVNRVLRRQLDWDTFERLLSPRATLPHLVLGVFEAERLVAINAFLPHDLHHEGQLVTAYQSCWGATRPECRRRGLFTRLVEEAAAQFRSQGVGLLFSVPNGASRAVYRAKLGFQSYGGFQHIRVARFPGASRFAVRVPGPGQWIHTDSGYRQNDAQLIEHKRRILGSRFAQSEREGNVLWGRTASVRGLRVLEVGGIIVNAPSHLHLVLDQAMKAHSVHALRLLTHTSSSYSALFRYGTVSPHAGELLVRPLHATIDEHTRFNFWNGIIDVF